MNIRAVAAGSAALCLVLTAAGCSSSGSGGGQSGGSGGGASIKVGFDSPTAYTNDMPIWIAIDKGFFKKHGLKVSAVGFSAGSDAVKGLISNSIQVQAGVGFDVVSAQAAGQKVQGFFGLAQKTDFGLFVGKDSSIKSFADLEGKSVAISAFGSYTDYLSKSVAKKQGLKNFKELPLHQTPAIVAALLNGSVDSAWEPMQLAPLFKGKTRVLDAATLGLESQYSTLSATQSYLNSHATEMKAFVAAMKEAIAYHQSHKAESIALAVVKLGIPKASAEQGYAGASKIYVTDGKINSAGMQAMAAAAPSLGFGSKVPTVEAMINTSFTR